MAATVTAKAYGTREEHLAWCKQRAFEYCDRDDPQQAFASFLSDMRKHDETKDHLALRMMLSMKLSGGMTTATETRKFINGFN